MPYLAYPDGSALIDFLAGSGLVAPTPAGSHAMIAWGLRAAAFARQFEHLTGRRYLAQFATRTYRNPNTTGVLILKQDLAAAPKSVVVGTTAMALGTDYWMLPENADADGRPWQAIQFVNPDLLMMNLVRGIQVTGAWGYSLEIPDDVYLAMLAGAAASLRTEIAAAITNGLLAWKDADVEEKYGGDGLKELVGGWQGIWDTAVAYFRQAWVG